MKNDPAPDPVFALYNRGQCSAKEMIATLYGSYPPPGLTNEGEPIGRIIFKSSLTDFKNLASRLTKPFRVPYYALSIASITLLSALAQNGSPGITLALSCAAVTLGHNFLVLAGYVHPEQPEVVRINPLNPMNLSSPAFKAALIGHESNHSHEIQNLPGDIRTYDFESLKGKSSLTVAKILTWLLNDVCEKDYFLDERELHANLETCLVTMSKNFGRVPLSQTELWAGLMSLGFDAPDSICKEVSHLADSPFTAARANHAINSNVKLNFQTLISAISPEGKEKLWHTVFPLICSGLYEGYKAPKDAERMKPTQGVEEFLRPAAASPAYAVHPACP